MGDALDGVLEAVCPVVHGVDAPGVTGAVMAGVEDAVHDGVAEVDVGMRHVDFGAEHLGAVGEFAVLHAHEELDGAVAEGAVASGLVGGSAGVADFVGGLVVDVGETLADEHEGELVHLREVVGGVADIAVPVVAEPVDVLLDGLDEGGVLLDGVGVVHAEGGLAAEFLGDAEVDAEGLGVSDVEAAVGLWGEACPDVAALVLAAAEVFGDNVTDKVAGGVRRRIGGVGLRFRHRGRSLLRVTVDKDVAVRGRGAVRGPRRETC